MPAHYINYSRLNLQNEKVHPFIIDFLERAIEIENKGLNKSIWLSLVNLLDSYYYLDLTKSIYQEDYKYEYLIDFIETFEKRVSEIKNFQLIWDNVFLF